MITIRSMTISDLPAIDEVQRASFIEELWEDMSLFQGILEHYDRGSFVAHKDGKLIGYLITHPSRLDRDDFETGCEELRGDEESLYIHDLCVSPDARGMGVAKVLMKHIEAFAKETAFTKLSGIAVQDAQSFWERQGFKSIKPYPYHGEPGVLMVKEI